MIYNIVATMKKTLVAKIMKITDIEITVMLFFILSSVPESSSTRKPDIVTNFKLDLGLSDNEGNSTNLTNL